MVEYNEGYSVCSDCQSILVVELSQDMMDEYKNTKMENTLSTIKPLTNIGIAVISLLKPEFAGLTVVASVLGELFGYFDNKSTERRLKKLQDKIENLGIKLEDFKLKLDAMDEHGAYFIRNSIKHLCLSALPETVDVLNKSIIDYIMANEKDKGLPEEAGEIIRQLNAHDISQLRKIKRHISNNISTSKLLSAPPKIEHETTTNEPVSNSEIKFVPRRLQDRNMIYGSNTIMWSDYSAVSDPDNDKIPELGSILNTTLVNEKGEKIFDHLYEPRSLLKLQSLGVLHFDIVNSMGFISPININRFHITHFGLKILEYID